MTPTTLDRPPVAPDAGESASAAHASYAHEPPPPPDAPRARMPPQIKFIIGNEACERFSFYGMKNTLTAFLITYLLLQRTEAEATYHLFVSACYLFPLLGGYLADRWLGKYRTIFWLSLVYCCGNAMLAIFPDSQSGFYTGLGLIALGSGGIKPCVATLVGDQFTEKDKHLARRVFAWFYWIINFGSFFASAIIPKTLEWYGPSVAFGIPGILMAISTFILWLGRKQYVEIPVVRSDPHSFFKVVLCALRNRKKAAATAVAAVGGARRHWLDAAAGLHPASAIEGVKAVFRVLVVFAPIPFFWALYDQKGSTWIVQAREMDLELWGMSLAPSQILALNPILVMLLIPLSEYVVYPALARRGWSLTPLRRMTIGMFIAGIAFLLVAFIQFAMDAGAKPSVVWQAGPYVVLTLAEVLVSTTGLEFAYSQAPAEMKSIIMSFFNLTVTVGNLLTAYVASMNIFKGGVTFVFYAVLICIAGVALWFIARRYKSVDQYRKA